MYATRAYASDLHDTSYRPEILTAEVVQTKGYFSGSMVITLTESNDMSFCHRKAGSISEIPGQKPDVLRIT